MPDAIRRVGLDDQVSLLLGPDGKPVPASLRGDRSGFDDVGNPMAPIVDATEPRSIAVRTGSNLSFTPRRQVDAAAQTLQTFQQLRALADFDLVRIVMEDVKGQIRGMSFDVQVRKEDRKRAEELQPKVDAIRAWVERPDPLAGLEFDDWLGSVLEDVLAVDALTLYPQRSRSGKATGLVQVDGATIIPLVDDRGRPPLPPLPAYQQIIRGRIETEFKQGELWYLPRNRRADSPYGRSPVENVVITVNLAIRQQLHELAFYTDGSLPDSLYQVPTNWKEQQVREFQKFWDDLMSGQSSKRAGGLRFVPGGDGAQYIATKDHRVTYDQLEWLARIIAWSFGVSPMPVAKMVNRATAETMESSSLESGVRPIAQFVARVITRYIREVLGVPEVVVRVGEDETEEGRDVVDRQTRFIAAGVMSRDEVRTANGMDPLPDGAGELHSIDTATGPLFLADLVKAREASEKQQAARIDPSLIQRAFLEVPIITRDELRASIGLQPVGGPSGDEFVTILAVGGPGSPGPVDPAATAALPGGAAAGLEGGEPDDATPVATGQDATGASPGSPPTGDDDVDVAKAVAVELKRWRSVASKAVAAGKRPRFFRSDVLDFGQVYKIAGALAKASTVDAVRDVFRKADPSPSGQAAAQAKMTELIATWIDSRWDDILAFALDALATVSPELLKWKRNAIGLALTKQLVPGIDDLAIDLDDIKLTQLHADFAETLQFAAKAGSTDALSIVNLDFDTPDAETLEFANARAAELVGRKWVDGELVANPNPVYRISDALRSDINDKVVKAIKEGWSPDRLTSELRDALGAARAETVARTETALSYAYGSQEAFDVAGVATVEILDGPGCLPFGHKDGAALPDKSVRGVQSDRQANGQVWTVQEYRQNSIGHPRCVRAAVVFEDEEGE